MTMPGTFIESHRYPQRALLQDLVLPDERPCRRWSGRTTVAVRHVSSRFWMPKDFLYRLSTPCLLRRLRADPTMSPKGGY